MFLQANARAPPALKGSREWKGQGQSSCRALIYGEPVGSFPRVRPRLPQSPAVPAGTWQCQPGLDGTAAPLPSPTGHSRPLPAGNVRAVPVSSVLFQLFTFNSTNWRFQTKQKEDARCDMCGGENGRLFLWNRWVFSHRGYLWRERGGVAGLALHVSGELEPSPGTLLGLGPSREPQSPVWEWGHSSELLGDTLCCPPGLGPLLQQLQERLVLSWKCCCCSPAQLLPWPCTPGTALSPCCLPTARAAPAFPGQEGVWEASLWGQRAVGLCCELSCCPCAPVSPRVKGDSDTPAPGGWQDELCQCHGGVRNNKTQNVLLGSSKEQ